MRRLQALCVGALPDWATRVDVPLVQVEGPSYGFPFELLPVFDLSRPPNPISNLEVFCRRFLGFSAAVRRVQYLRGSGLGLPLDPVLKGGPLPLSLAWHTRLSGAKTEHDFFAGLAEHIELNGPWPAPKLTLQAVVEKLVQGLADPRQRYNASAGLGPEVQIHHFSCHCDTKFDDPNDYRLELAGTDGLKQRMTFIQLYNEFTYAEGASNATRPLVFLNACGATHQDPRRVYSWPKWFIDNRHRAVIGPETDVPDEAAAQYACAFYRELFAQRSAGEALVLARRYLLTKFRNPLGLLYVLYGDSSITVDQPIPQEVLDGGAVQ
jgi:hypothetical protein